MRARLLALLAACLPAAVSAQPAPPKPKLVVMISVDQFSADLFAQYRATFTSGLKRLTTGAVFPSGFQSHAATETCPGHSTILTGSHPARTGIIANTWYDLSTKRGDKAIYCAEDEGVDGSTSRKYEPSAVHLRVPTLGDRMKQVDPATKIVSVAGKDRAAIMMGGHAVDQIWFSMNDSFRTLAGRSGPVPPVVAATNARVAALLAKPERQVYPPRCAAMVRPIALAKITVGGERVRAAGDASGFRATPAFDAAVTDIAIDLLKQERLGRGASTDLLIVGLSATDYVGHGFGPGGPEICAQMAALDATIGRLLAALDANGVPYVVGLTADHGGHDLPERSAMQGEPLSVRVDPALSPAAIDKAIRAEFGLGAQTVWGDGPFGDIYVARDLAPALRQRVIAAVRARYTANPQVEAVFSADELARRGSPDTPVDEWSLIERARASFDPARSGDLVVALKPHVVPIADPRPGIVATHGSFWNYDRRVPILFWRPGMTGFEQPAAVETVDILPTLAALIGLDVPAREIDGRCLDLDAGPGSTCTAALR